MDSKVTHIKVRVLKNCSVCKTTYEWEQYMPNNNTCHTCQHWAQTAVWDIIQQDHVIINHEHYRFSDASSGFNFGGRMFKIKFNDGRIVETMLAHQGTIPERFLMTKDMDGNTIAYEVFKDNAVFINDSKD